jgi:hypothetical protein
MDLSNILPWVAILASLVGGGAMGAVITQFAAARRNQQQPIARQIEFVEVFTDTLGTSSLQTQIAVVDGTDTVIYKNLHVGIIRLTNAGNIDFNAFQFGVTLSPGDTVIHVDSQTIDRLHRASPNQAVTPKQPKAELDFSLAPFNRKETYTIRLFIVTPPDKSAPGPISIATAHSVRIIDQPSSALSWTEGLRAAAAAMILAVAGVLVASYLFSPSAIGSTVPSTYILSIAGVVLGFYFGSASRR